MLRSRGETRVVARQTTTQKPQGDSLGRGGWFYPQRVDLLSALSVLCGPGAFLWRPLPGDAEQKPGGTSPPEWDLGAGRHTGQDSHSALLGPRALPLWVHPLVFPLLLTKKEKVVHDLGSDSPAPAGDRPPSPRQSSAGGLQEQRT